jgi:hypothetical protein
MSGINEIPPAILRDHHRLSLQQVNSLFGSIVFPESVGGKIKEFEILKEFFSVCDLLKAEEIEFIPLKGPELSYRLYGDATIRNYNDIDILVNIHNMTRVINLIELTGYKIAYNKWPEKRTIQRKFTTHVNHITFINSEKATIIEIHWRLLRTPAISFSGFENLIYRNLSILNFAGRSFRILNNELELLYIIIHGGLHFWSRLKWLLDVDIFIKTQNIDWMKFKELTIDLKAEKMVGLCRKIHSDYFSGESAIPVNFPIPHRIVEYTRTRIADNKDTAFGSLKKVLENFRYTLFAFRGLRYKIQVIRSFVFMSFFSGKMKSVIA